EPARTGPGLENLETRGPVHLSPELDQLTGNAGTEHRMDVRGRLEVVRGVVGEVVAVLVVVHRQLVELGEGNRPRRLDSTDDDVAQSMVVRRIEVAQVHPSECKRAGSAGVPLRRRAWVTRLRDSVGWASSRRRLP